MNLRTVIFGVALLGAGAVIGGSVFSQDKKGHEAPSMDEQMANWMKYANPAEQHKDLAKAEGTWETTSKHFMPGMPAMESKGTATFKMILDGRFQQGDFQGTMMGMPFHGVGITGYDLFKKKYTNIWMDSMGTMMMYAEGTSTDNGKTITFETTMDDLGTGEMGKKIRYVLHNTDADTMSFEMFSHEKSGEFKCMEIVYKRKKATKS